MVVIDADACACACEECCSKTEGETQPALTQCKCPSRSEASCCKIGESVEEVADAPAAAGEIKSKYDEIVAAAAAADAAAADDELPECCAPGAAQKTPELSAPRREWLVTVASGMATSGCCLLQLALNGLAMLNIAHVGCAGFNKVLGPWRTEMRTATVGK
jgi:hypothetical protein